MQPCRLTVKRALLSPVFGIAFAGECMDLAGDTGRLYESYQYDYSIR